MIFSFLLLSARLYLWRDLPLWLIQALGENRAYHVLPSKVLSFLFYVPSSDRSSYI